MSEFGHDKLVIQLFPRGRQRTPFGHIKLGRPLDQTFPVVGQHIVVVEGRDLVVFVRSEERPPEFFRQTDDGRQPVFL